MVGEPIAVDDGSTDRTWKLLSALRDGDPRPILHPALRTGFAIMKSPTVLVQDADLEYDPAEYEKLLSPILNGKADVVFGSRFRGSEAHRVLSFWHFVGNRFLTLLSNMLTNLNLTDIETGFKAFKGEVLQQIRLEEDRFGFEPEITAKVARLGVPIYESRSLGRTYAEGRKVDWRDGVSAPRCILECNFF